MQRGRVRQRNGPLQTHLLWAVPRWKLLWALRDGVHVVRTACVEETGMVVMQLVKKCAGKARGVPSGICPPSKRQRDSETVWMRQLVCIPSISERIARTLLEHFGTLRALQEALADVKTFPRIRLDARTCIGKSRIQMLARYLA